MFLPPVCIVWRRPEAQKLVITQTKRGNVKRNNSASFLINDSNSGKKLPLLQSELSLPKYELISSALITWHLTPHASCLLPGPAAGTGQDDWWLVLLCYDLVAVTFLIIRFIISIWTCCFTPSCLPTFHLPAIHLMMRKFPPFTLIRQILLYMAALCWSGAQALVKLSH